MDKLYKRYFKNKHSKADPGELILKNKEIANTFYDHFGSIVDNLGLDDHYLSPTKGSDTIDNIIKWYKKHPSIKNIKVKFNSVHRVEILTKHLNKSVETGFLRIISKK